MPTLGEKYTTKPTLKPPGRLLPKPHNIIVVLHWLFMR